MAACIFCLFLVQSLYTSIWVSISYASRYSFSFPVQFLHTRIWVNILYVRSAPRAWPGSTVMVGRVDKLCRSRC